MHKRAGRRAGGSGQARTATAFDFRADRARLHFISETSDRVRSTAAASATAPIERGRRVFYKHRLGRDGTGGMERAAMIRTGPDERRTAVGWYATGRVIIIVTGEHNEIIAKARR